MSSLLRSDTTDYPDGVLYHPGVAALCQAGEILLAGKVYVVNRPVHANFHRYRLDPIQCRKLFIEKGWRRVVGFQTRNPVHRAHEYIQKVAMETVDGLFLHPPIGETADQELGRCYGKVKFHL